MGLTLDKIPGLFVLSKNMIMARVKTDDFYSSYGTLQDTYIKFTAASTAGQTIIFTWATGSVTFTCAASPNTSGTQYKDNAVALPLATWVQQTIDYLNQNKLVYERYILSSTTIAGSPAIRIQSREKDGNSALTITGTGYNLALSFGTATSPVGKSNYAFVLETWLENSYRSGVYTKVDESELPANNDPSLPSADFYLEQVLDAYVEKDFPVYGQTSATLCTNIQKRYYVRYGEKYGNPQDQKKMYTSDVYNVLRGGVSHADYKASIGFYNNFVLGQQNYLSFSPFAKKVTPIQQEYLNVMVPIGSTQLRLYIKFYYSDGTFFGPFMLMSKTSLQPYDIVIFPAGHNQLNLSSYAPPGGTVDKYEIFFKDQFDQVCTLTKTYTVDRSVRLDNHYFLFTNPVNGTDTLRATGLHTTGDTFEREIAERTLAYDSDMEEGQQFQYYAEKGTVFKQNTGWLTKEEIDWALSAFLSDYIVEDVSEQFIPIIINTKTVTRYSSKQGLFALEFEYVHAFKSISPEVNLAGRIGYLVDSNGNYLVDSNGNKIIAL